MTKTTTTTTTGKANHIHSWKFVHKLGVTKCTKCPAILPARA